MKLRVYVAYEKLNIEKENKNPHWSSINDWCEPMPKEKSKLLSGQRFLNIS